MVSVAEERSATDLMNREFDLLASVWLYWPECYRILPPYALFANAIDKIKYVHICDP